MNKLRPLSPPPCLDFFLSTEYIDEGCEREELCLDEIQGRGLSDRGAPLPWLASGSPLIMLTRHGRIDLRKRYVPSLQREDGSIVS